MLADTVIKHNHKTIQSRRPVTDWHRPRAHPGFCV